MPWTAGSPSPPPGAGEMETLKTEVAGSSWHPTPMYPDFPNAGQPPAQEQDDQEQGHSQGQIFLAELLAAIGWLLGGRVEAEFPEGPRSPAQDFSMHLHNMATPYLTLLTASSSRGDPELILKGSLIREDLHLPRTGSRVAGTWWHS